MDFQRKNRWVRYPSDKCKLYLRNDFNFECAYCRMSENDVGTLAEEAFEKDHFEAQSNSSEEDIHRYSNMVYACRKCNNRKSNKKINLILDPCKDDIYSGENAHVYVNDNAELEYRTPQGKEFIENMNLNNRFYCKMRKKQSELHKDDEDIEICLNVLKERSIPEEIINKLSAKLKNEEANKEIQDQEEIKCGVSFAGECFKQVLDILKRNKWDYELILDEYEKDVKIQFENSEYQCEIVINKKSDKPVSTMRINSDRVDWLQDNKDLFGELYYYSKIGRLELVILDSAGSIIRRECICTGL